VLWGIVKRNDAEDKHSIEDDEQNFKQHNKTLYAAFYGIKSYSLFQQHCH